MRTQKIFISHAYSDSDWARQFAASMLKYDVKVWSPDLNIEPGEPIREVLENGLRESDVVVFLINSESIDKPNFFFELGAATAMGKKIIPVVAQDVHFFQLPLSIQDIRPLVRTSPEETAKRLADALRITHHEAA